MKFHQLEGELNKKSEINLTQLISINNNGDIFKKATACFGPDCSLLVEEWQSDMVCLQSGASLQGGGGGGEEG